MKRLIITTIILIAAAVLVTVVYFKNLSLPGQHISRVIQTIPDDAALIAEINNDKGFYDIFSNSELLPSLTGTETQQELIALQDELLSNPALKPFFSEQNIFISLHTTPVGKPGLLLTTSASKDFEIKFLDQLAQRPNTGLIIHGTNINGKPGYTIFINSIKKRFYLINKGDNVFAGSFLKEIAYTAAAYKSTGNEQFVLLPDQQNSNSLINLYVNHKQLQSLFDGIFKDKNTDIFRSFRSMPATASLTLNYKKDALMFNGYTHLQRGNAYLNLFSRQSPVINHIKNLFPSTTAHSISMAVSSPAKFVTDLADLQAKAGLTAEKNTLFNKIRSESGVNLATEFNAALLNEFAALTTRFQERVAIIQLKNGSQLRPYLVNISNMISDDVGQFNYPKLPFFLLGDAFSIFNKPYFRIADNYLFLANSPRELNSYYESYINSKFLTRSQEYNQFDELLSERSNVTFFMHFKNSQQLLKRSLKADAYSFYNQPGAGLKNYFAASYQLTSADKNFYTNFCMRLTQPDSVGLDQ